MCENVINACLLQFAMAKVVLHYFNGRGRMETIRWLLAVAGVEVRIHDMAVLHKLLLYTNCLTHLADTV